MGILTKEVEIRPRGKMIKYYNHKGYNAKYNQPLMINVEDLTNESCVSVKVLCDYCKETVCNPTYRDYYKRIRKFGNYACSKCRSFHDKETYMKNLGVDSPAKLEEVRKRMAETSLHRYGVLNPMQSLEVRAKANETLCQNGTQKTSKQQVYLRNLYGGELNYPVKYYAVDICLPDEKLVIEYDGGGHNLRVILGRLTQEEFNQKEIIRSNIIKKEGYKQIKIISSHDKLPQDSTLLQMLEQAKKYFLDYPEHSWCSYNIDQSMLFNAECKDGIEYNFGELRTIKDSDLNTKNITSLEVA